MVRRAPRSLVDAGALLHREVAYHDTTSPPSQTRSDPTVLDPTTGQAASRTYEFDALALGRLTRADLPHFGGLPREVSLTYDRDGNRNTERILSAGGAKILRTYCYNGGTNQIRNILFSDPPGDPSARRLPIQAAWEQMVATARYAVHHAGSAATLTRALEELETRLLEFAEDYDVRPERLFDALLADRRVRDALLAVFEQRAGRTEEPLDREDIRRLDLLLAALSALRIEEALLVPDPACVDPNLAPQFDYDEQGNAIQGPDQNVCQLFNERGQLIELSVPRVRLMPNPCRDPDNRTPTVRYEYDWRGRRVLERHLAFGPDRRFAYDQSDRLIAEYAVRAADSALVPLRQYFYHGGEPIAQAELGEVALAPGTFSCASTRAGSARSGAGAWATAVLLALAAVLLSLRRRRLAAAAALAGMSLLVCIPAASATHTVRYYINDGLGTPLRLVGRDASGRPEVQWAAEYGPFGEDYVMGGSSAVQPLRFPGQYDNGTLHYNLHRNYAPGWGRYLEVDPWAADPRTATEYVRIESANPYVYARNNPLEFFDPEGLHPVTVTVECPGLGTAERSFDSAEQDAECRREIRREARRCRMPPRQTDVPPDVLPDVLPDVPPSTNPPPEEFGDGARPIPRRPPFGPPFGTPRDRLGNPGRDGGFNVLLCECQRRVVDEVCRRCTP